METSPSKIPLMRKLTLHNSGAKPERGKGLSVTTNNIWKLFLLFLAVALLNTIYITQSVLTPEEANQRFDLQLLNAFVKGGVNKTWVGVFNDVEINGDDTVLEEFEEEVAAEEKVLDEGTGKSNAEEVVDKTSPKFDEMIARITNTNLVRTHAEYDAAQNKNVPVGNVEKNAPEVGVHMVKTNSEIMSRKAVEPTDLEDENNHDVEDEDEDENDSDDKDDNDNEDEDDESDHDGEDEGGDNDTEDEDDNDEDEEDAIPLNITKMGKNSTELLNWIKAHNATITSEADAEEIEIQYRPRIGKKKKKKKKKNLVTTKRKMRRKKKKKRKPVTAEQRAKWKPRETAFAPNISNAEFYRDIPSEFLVEDPSLYLWDRPELMIPEWMKDYFRWHRWKRSTWKNLPPARKYEWNATELQWWESERWLISQCLMKIDQRKCGGTADRLKPIPVLLRVAYENKRVFLIRWTRPAPLEEFLMPPVGGFDWRLPPELNDVMDDFQAGKRLPTRKLILEYAAKGLALVRARYQTGMPASSYNDLVFDGAQAEVDDKEIFGFDTIYSRVWKVLFTPVPPIQAIIQNKLSTLGLVPNEYVAAHLRALYATEDRPPQEIKRFTENALACATTIYPGVPIFFASDSNVALERAQSFNGKEVQDPLEQSIKLKVLTAADVPTPSKNKGNHTQPWHLDSYIGPVENFYDTFVDLYMMAMGGCVTFGKGGYGNWAALIGGHYSCRKEQHHIGKRVKHPDVDYCKFHATNESYENIVQNFDTKYPSIFGAGNSEPIFLPPMD